MAVAVYAAESEKDARTPCVEDAMIVFGASGSMSGDGWGYGSETAGTVSRIDKVRATLAEATEHHPNSPRRPHHLRSGPLQSMQRHTRAPTDLDGEETC